MAENPIREALKKIFAKRTRFKSRVELLDLLEAELGYRPSKDVLQSQTYPILKKAVYSQITDLKNNIIIDPTIEVPKPIITGGAGTGKTQTVIGAKFPSEKIKNEYIELLENKYKNPKGTSYTNKSFYEKFMKPFKVGHVSDVERINTVLVPKLKLKFPKITPSARMEKRSKRLDKTVGQKAKYLRGTDAFPFHHIMPIGGEAQLTTNDIAIISKQMNSKLSPYNTKLNDIADAISDNISKAFATKSEGGSSEFMKRIDELNDQAEKLVAKATKELPKKFQPYIGFTKLTPRTDEYGFPLDDSLIEERVGAVREKGIPLRDLTSKQLKELRANVITASAAGKIGFFDDIRADAVANGPICSLVRTKKANGGTISCVDAVEEAIQKEPEKLAQKASRLEKFKNSATGFLNFVKKGGKFGAIAAVGAAGAGLVKTFMNDDPTTYLSNEDQQKNMLISMITDPVVDEPKSDAAILDYQLPVIGAGAVAGTAAVAPSTIEAARSGALGAKKSGITKTGLKTLGRGLASLGTPLGLLATEPLFIGGQIAQGDSLTEIATDPINYLGAAFADPATRFATKGVSPGIAKAMRLGISPSVLKTVSRRFGLPGLALSLGISGYETFDDYRNKRGFFSEE